MEFPHFFRALYFFAPLSVPLGQFNSIIWQMQQVLSGTNDQNEIIDEKFPKKALFVVDNNKKLAEDEVQFEAQIEPDFSFLRFLWQETTQTKYKIDP